MVAERLRTLVSDVNRGDGQAVAAYFLAGPDLRWEVREHFDAPNGTLGALRTLDVVAGFARVLHERGEVWASKEVVPPAHYVEGAPAVYGFRVAVTAAATTQDSPVKVAVDCESGRLTHMVGPSGPWH